MGNNTRGGKPRYRDEQREVALAASAPQAGAQASAVYNAEEAESIPLVCNYGPDNNWSAAAQAKRRLSKLNNRTLLIRAKAKRFKSAKILSLCCKFPHANSPITNGWVSTSSSSSKILSSAEEGLNAQSKQKCQRESSGFRQSLSTPGKFQVRLCPSKSSQSFCTFLGSQVLETESHKCGFLLLMHTTMP